MTVFRFQFAFAGQASACLRIFGTYENRLLHRIRNIMTFTMKCQMKKLNIFSHQTLNADVLSMETLKFSFVLVANE